MFNLPLADAADDLDEFIPTLEEIQQSAKDRLRGVFAALKEIHKIQAAKEHLEYIQQHGIPRPRAEQGQPQARTGPAGEQPGSGEGLSRRQLVQRLPAQTPEREWKVKEIAAALGIDNEKSLRTSLDDFARTSVIGKNAVRSTYFHRTQTY